MTLESGPKNLETPRITQEMLGSEVHDDLAREDGVEHGAIKKKIEIPGVGEIEYTGKTIMFPEKIVQETGGVKGYVRKMVSWEELLRFWDIDESEWEKIKAGQIYHSREELEEENKKRLAEGRSDLLHSEETLNEYPKKESIEKFKKTEGINLVMSILTNGEFIKQTINHIVDRGVSKDRELARDGMLEKIKIKRSWKPFDTKTNKLLSKRELCEKSGLSDNFLENSRFAGALSRGKKEIFENKLLSTRDVFFRSDCGLNLANPGQFWNGYSLKGGDADSPMLDCIALGFKRDTRNAVLRKYSKSVLDLMKKSKMDYKTEKFYDDFYEWEAKKTLEFLLKPIKNSKKNFVVGVVFNGNLDEGSHPRIPIVINHPDIPELRWCHADYAAIPTKNGYNIIEMIT